MKFSANRVVAALHAVIVVLTIVGFYIAAVTKSLPEKWQATAAAVAGVVAALIAGTTVAVKFLDGSQKSEALDKNPGLVRLQQDEARQGEARVRIPVDTRAATEVPRAPRRVDISEITDQAPVPVGELDTGPSDEELLADAGDELLDSDRWLANREAVPEVDGEEQS